MSRRGHLCSSLLALLACVGPRVEAQDSAVAMWTGFTGTITASGLENPQYVLSFRPIQRLVQRAARQPVDQAVVDSALVGTPVSRSDLLQLGLLEKTGDQYRIAYLFLTADDQRAIARVGARFGPDLAAALDAHRAEFERIVARYPLPTLRSQLAFALVAGILLNWEGLDLTTEWGYRAHPVRHPNGDVYIVHSAEVTDDQSDTGLYWESHTFPSGRMRLSSFGDAPSVPRLGGLPDIFDGAFDDGLAALRATPDRFAAARQYLLLYLGEDLTDAGRILTVLRRGPLPRATLRARCQLSSARFATSMQLMMATRYTEERNGRVGLLVPVLLPEDKSLVDSTLALGRRVLHAWLEQNYPAMRQQLADLSPMRSGLPFALPFSEVWHAVFGQATKQLAADRLYADPRAPASLHQGYVPLVWDASVYRPGSQ